MSDPIAGAPAERGLAGVNGTHLFYEIAGAGPPLVLIHGFALDCRLWDGQFTAFARRFRVLRYDARGFGQSAPPDDAPYTHAADLAALMAHLGIARAALIGLSLGGEIATDFALAFPAMTHALILVDSAMGGYRWSDEWRTRAGAVWRAGRTDGVEVARQLWLAMPIFAPALQDSTCAEPLRRMVADYSGWHWVHRDPLGGAVPAAIERLPAVQATTLIVVGERDMADFHTIADRAAQEIPHARKITLPGAGHLPNMETPAAFTTLVQQFLDDYGVTE